MDRCDLCGRYVREFISRSKGQRCYVRHTVAPFDREVCVASGLTAEEAGREARERRGRIRRQDLEAL